MTASTAAYSLAPLDQGVWVEQAETDWRLPWWWPGLVVAPLIVFAGANYIMVEWGAAQFQMAQPLVPDGHAEASARLRTFSAFLAFVALAVAAILYAADNVRRLPRSRRTELIQAYWMTLAVGGLLMFALGLHRGEGYLEDKLPCASFELLTKKEVRSAETAGAAQTASATETAGAAQRAGAAQTDTVRREPAGRPKAAQPRPKPAAEAAGGTRPAPVATTAKADKKAVPAPSGAPERLPRAATKDLKCGVGYDRLGLPEHREGHSNGWRQLRIMFAISAFFLVLATPAVLWGAVACLALPAGGSRRDRYEAWAAQTARLNRLLYVTAGFLVAGLFFSSTRWSWPGYSLHPDDAGAYADHVRSLVAYVGVLNSLLIASYYVPVAAKLAASSPPAPFAGARAGGGGGGGARPDPFGPYTRALAILSPAILGFVAELLKFSP